MKDFESNYEIIKKIKSYVLDRKVYKYLVFLLFLIFIFYWVICSALDSIIYKEDSFWVNLISPHRFEFYHRVIIAVLLMILGVIIVLIIKNISNNILKITDLYDEIFNYHTDGIALYKVMNNGENFIIRDFNKTAERIESVKKDEIIGRKLTEVFPGIEDFDLLNVFRRVWKTGEPEHFPIKHYKDRRLSGWRENHVYKLSGDYIVAEFEDKTKEKKLEEKLKKSEEKLRTIFETAPISI